MNRQPLFDVARSLSILYIIGILHMSGYGEFTVLYGDAIKNAALGLFMFISAYLLGQKYQIHTYREALSFFINRSVRIIPLYAVSLSLYLCKGYLSLRTALLSLLGLSSIIPPNPATLWFVSMLILFYFLFVLLCGRKWYVQILLVVFVFLFALSMSHYLCVPIDRRFFYYFPCFALGVIFARGNALNLTLKSPQCLFIFLLTFAVSILYEDSIWRRMMLSLSGAMLILYVSSFLQKSLLICRFFRWIAYASMSSYLFHRQLFSVIRSFVFWPEDLVTRRLFLYIVCLPLVIVLGFYVQKSYDYIIQKVDDFIHRQ